MLIRLFVLIGGLIVLALTAALIGPYFIDWTPYRADFEREASRVLGRQVTVAGTATARLLPFPSVTFSDVRVAGPDDKQTIMTAERFSMDAELAPFLRGEILIFDMRIIHPRMRLGIDRNGMLDLAVRPDTPVDPRQIELENVSIVDGEIDLNHALSGREHHLRAINATLSARSLAGPWRSQGRLLADGRPVSFQLSTGAAMDKGGMRLRLRMKPDNYPVAVESDGDVNIKNGRIIYDGQFSVADFLRGDTSKPGSEMAFSVPGAGGTTGNLFRLTGRFSLDNSRLDIDQFRFESGDRNDPYIAQGKALVDLGADPHFSITANGQQWRLPQNTGGKSGSATMTLQERFDTLTRLVAAIPEPTIPGMIEINLPAIVAGGTTIRDVSVSAKPQGGTWVIGNASAKLPGRSTIEASGTLSVGENPAFTGSLLLAVAQPSGFAAWLATDVNDAIRRLPSAGFSAKVQLTPDKQVFNDLELILGNAKFRGHAERDNPADGEPGVVAALAGGAIDEESLRAFISMFSGQGARQIAGGNIDLQFSAGPVSFAGLTAATADTALRLKDNKLEVDKLTINDLYGTEISATGTVEKLDSKPSGRLDASIIAVDLQPLLHKLDENYPRNTLVSGLEKRAAGYPQLFKDSRINVIASVSTDDANQKRAAAVSANGTSGGTQFSLTATGSPESLVDPKAQFSVSVTASNEDGGHLLALYGLPVLPVAVDRGLDTDFNARGSLDGGIDVSASMRSDEDTASFEGSVTAGTDGSTEARGKLKLDASDLEPWLIATGIAYPGMGIGLPVSLSSAVELDGGVLRFSGLSGKIVDGTVAGDFAASMENGVPKITGTASFDTVLMEPMAMALFGDEAFAAEPDAWPQTAFSLNPLVPALLDLQIKAKSVEGGVAGFATDAGFHLRLDDAGLLISDFSGTYAGGRLEGRLDLKNNGGTGLASTQIKLQGADAATLFPQAGLGGKIDLAGSFTANGKTVDGLVASLAGSGTSRVKDFSVEGLNSGAFGAIIQEADKAGRDIEKTDVAGFAIPLVSDGTFRAAALDFPFSVASGVIRTAPVSVTNPEAELSLELRADLPAGTASVQGTLTYNAGKEALVGSDPVVRVTAKGSIPVLTAHYDVTALKQYLVQRALEREQDRVERMQAVLLEKQRLRRYVSVFLEQEDMRQAERKRREEQARQAAEEARKAAEEARKAAAAQKAAEEQANKSGQDKAAGGGEKQPADLFPKGKVSLDEFIRSLSQ